MVFKFFRNDHDPDEDDNDDGAATQKTTITILRSFAFPPTVT